MENELRSYDGFSIRRIFFVTTGLVFLGVLCELLFNRSLAGALSLTAAGLVAIINFCWLEEILQHVVQAGEPRFDGRSVLRIFGRMLLLGGLMAALLLVPRIDPVAVALGFTAFVVALIVEGFRWARDGGG
jgi:hypothetical protein